MFYLCLFVFLYIRCFPTQVFPYWCVLRPPSEERHDPRFSRPQSDLLVLHASPCHPVSLCAGSSHCHPVSLCAGSSPCRPVSLRAGSSPCHPVSLRAWSQATRRPSSEGRHAGKARLIGAAHLNPNNVAHLNPNHI